MPKTVRITVIQDVHLPHDETISRSWYDHIARTIVREFDAAGTLVSEEVVDEEVIEAHCDMEEETIDTDANAAEEEVVSEDIESEEVVESN
jgi:hypothetical protein